MYLFGKVMVMTGAYSNKLFHGDDKRFAAGFIFNGVGIFITIVSLIIK